MVETNPSFESFLLRLISALKTDLKTLYSMIFKVELIPRPGGPIQEAVEAEERSEEAQPVGDIHLPKTEPRTPEEEARQKQKMVELRQRQKETGSDQAYEEYLANKEEIQRTEGTHQRIGDSRREIYRR